MCKFNGRAKEDERNPVMSFFFFVSFFVVCEPCEGYKESKKERKKTQGPRAFVIGVTRSGPKPSKQKAFMLCLFFCTCYNLKIVLCSD